MTGSKANAKPPQQMDDATRQDAWEGLVRLRIRGASQKQCAAKLGFHVNTIKKWSRNPAFRLKMSRTRELVFQRTAASVEELADRQLERFKGQIEEVLENYSIEAVNRIRQLMYESTNEAISLKAAIDLADRDPKTMKTKKVQATVGHAFLTPELLMAAAKAAREIQENESVGRVIEPVPLDETMAEEIPETLEPKL